jgi:uncharacterized membrane protein
VKKYLLTGLIILLPLALTVMIIFFLFDFFTGPFVPIVSTIITKLEAVYHFTLPVWIAMFISRVLALILLCIFILLLGALARWLLLRNLFHLGHLLISRIPFVKTIYKVSRDIFSALFSSEGKKAFKYPVIFPFPFPPSQAIGFQAGEVAEECQQKIKTPLVSVFMPTSPHPISGFLFLVPEKDVRKIEMTNEDAVKFLVSCGIIHPQADKPETDEIP